MVESDVRRIFKDSRSSKPNLITKEDIKELPEPVKRYLKYTKIVGKETIETVKLQCEGFFRLR